jgi:uncharacterized Zn-binding protein involved in type VI secretion
MLKRYHITLGATTTAGGTVTTASAPCSINGGRVALEGDKVACPSCHSDGVIRIDGPRISERWSGKQVALHDDLCLCKCTPPPRLVAIQTHKCQSINDMRAAAPENAGQVGRAPETTPPTSADASDAVPIRFLDPATRQPIQHKQYRLHFRDKVIEGITDDKGETMPITAQDRVALIAWHVDGSSVVG